MSLVPSPPCNEISLYGADGSISCWFSARARACVCVCCENTFATYKSHTRTHLHALFNLVLLNLLDRTNVMRRGTAQRLQCKAIAAIYLDVCVCVCVTIARESANAQAAVSSLEVFIYKHTMYAKTRQSRSLYPSLPPSHPPSLCPSLSPSLAPPPSLSLIVKST